MSVISNAREQAGHMSREIEFVRGITLILAVRNNAINFLLYAVSSSNFRRELKNLCIGMTKWRDVYHCEDIYQPSSQMSKNQLSL